MNNHATTYHGYSRTKDLELKKRNYIDVEMHFCRNNVLFILTKNPSHINLHEVFNPEEREWVWNTTQQIQPLLIVTDSDKITLTTGKTVQ